MNPYKVYSREFIRAYAEHKKDWCNIPLSIRTDDFWIMYKGGYEL